MSELLKILRDNPLVKTANEAEILYAKTSAQYKSYVTELNFTKFITSDAKHSFLWHDYEAGGTDAKSAAPLQCAMVRTDLELNIIDAPIDLYCMLHGDKLPHPAAIKITKINPMHCIENGIKEPDFFRLIAEQMMHPNTCNAGYNSLSYDDEMTRFGFFRSLIPVYDREWKNGCSRWDLYPVTAAFYAKFPEAIQWPKIDGVISLKLENIAKANNITQDSAHNAVDDVMALISLAKTLKDICPTTWRYLLDTRNKQTNANLISKSAIGYILHKNIGSESGFKAPVVILGEIPGQKGSFVYAKLDQIDSIREVYRKNTEEIKQLVFLKKDELELFQKKRPAIQKIQTNKQPQFFPIGHPLLSDLTKIDEALIDVAKRLCAQSDFVSRLVQVFCYDDKEASPNVERSLYSVGFASNADQLKINKTYSIRGVALEDISETFDGQHYNTLQARLVSKIKDDANWSELCKLALTEENAEDKHEAVHWHNVIEILKAADLPESLHKGYRNMLTVFAKRAGLPDPNSQ